MEYYWELRSKNAQNTNVSTIPVLLCLGYLHNSGVSSMPIKTLEYYRGQWLPESNAVTTWNLREHASECFPRFSTFIFLCTLFIRARAVVLALFHLAKAVVSGTGVRRNFSRAGQSRHFAFSVCWRSKCNANGRTQKVSNVMATVTYNVFPIRTFYTEKILVLVRLDILRQS